MCVRTPFSPVEHRKVRSWRQIYIDNYIPARNPAPGSIPRFVIRQALLWNRCNPRLLWGRRRDNAFFAAL